MALSNSALVLGERHLPINQIHELPGILSELDFQLSFLIERELGFWIQKARAFALIFVIYVEFTGSQVKGLGLGIKQCFTDSTLPIGANPNPSPTALSTQPDPTHLIPS